MSKSGYLRKDARAFTCALIMGLEKFLRKGVRERERGEGGKKKGANSLQ